MKYSFAKYQVSRKKRVAVSISLVLLDIKDFHNPSIGQLVKTQTNVTHFEEKSFMFCVKR